jgi:hypothetical protein
MADALDDALLDPLEPLPNPCGFTPTAPAPIMDPSTDPEIVFNVGSYAAAHGVDARMLRRKLRAAGHKAPYALADVMAVLRDIRDLQARGQCGRVDKHRKHRKRTVKAEQGK